MSVKETVSLSGVACAMLLACTDATAPVETTTPSPAHSTVHHWEDGAATYWNEVARNLVASNSSNALVAIRAYAIVSLAQYHAAIAAEDGKVPGTHPSMRAAVGAASVRTLAYLYPTQISALEDRLDAFLDSPASPGQPYADVQAGETIGKAVGDQVVARAQGDNFFAPWTGTVPVGPGIWFSATAPVGATIGQARTFFLTSGSQFRPPPPPAFGSAEFLAALAEVRQISDTRTAAQVATAVFWNLPAGTHQPPGYWNAEGARLAVQYRLNERRAAHLFALMNMVAYDAIVASHEAKFAYWLLRPTMADPAITLPIGLPNFPSYPSNHAAISAGMARVLGDAFPAESARLDALADEAALSRVYGGIHFRFDGEAGLTLGRTIAAWALQHDVEGHQPFVLR
jgi:membrane-associated phospholipid phosphatase